MPLPEHLPVLSLDAILSGRKRGMGAAFLRGGLRVASGFYALGRQVHRALYRTGLRRRVRLPRPVLSVGNLTTGGAGKTPLVAHVAQHLRGLGLHPAVLARGYGRAAGAELNEEGQWLQARVPGLVVAQGADRVVQARRVLERHPCDVFLLDDGFQHERLVRDLDIVAIDATRPFGYGHYLPRGLLRDAPRELRRADFLVITRVELVAARELSTLRARLCDLAPQVPQALMRFAVEELRRGDDSLPPSTLEGRDVVVVSGVGNPRSVRATVESLGARAAVELVFPDHAGYAPADLRRIDEACRRFGTDWVTTEKDAVKLGGLGLSRPPLVLCQSFHVEVGAAELAAAVERVVSGADSSG